MSRFLWSLAVCSLTLLTTSLGEADEPVAVNIAQRLELLVDDTLIDTMQGAAFKLHSPRPAEVALQFDKAWEGSGNHYLTVFDDGDGYHMYYHSV
ncbi:MAG: hypothetical protein MK364_24885, partial [Pirellulales bacterium]|nr:hypothetical protein [Pirellulales bacterium]